MARKITAEVEIKATDNASATLRKTADAFDEVEESAEDAGDALEDSGEKAGASGGRFAALGGLLAGAVVAGFAAAAAAVVKFVEVLQESARAAGEQQAAVDAVRTALAGIGVTSAEATRETEAWASALQRTTAVGDETLLRLNALAISFTENAEQARQLTEVALDFAQGASISQEEALRRLGRTLGGAAADVANFDDRIAALTKEQLANGEAIDLIGEKYENFAKDAADNYLGAIKRLEDAQGDASEALGETFTKNDALVASLRRGVNAANGAAEANRALSEALGPLAALWQDYKNAVTEWQTEIKAAVAAALDFTNRLFGLTEAQKELKAETEGGILVQEKQNEKRKEQLVTEEEFEAQLLSIIAAYEEDENALNSLIATEEEARRKKQEWIEEGKEQEEQIDNITEATKRNTAAVVENIIVTQQQIALQQSFDEIARAQGRAAAVEAELARGGRLELSGTRIRLASGGSRLTREVRPFYSSV